MPTTSATVNSTTWTQLAVSAKCRLYYDSPKTSDNEIYVTLAPTTPIGNVPIIAVLDKDDRSLTIDSVPTGEHVYVACKSYADTINFTDLD